MACKVPSTGAAPSASLGKGLLWPAWFSVPECFWVSTSFKPELSPHFLPHPR